MKRTFIDTGVLIAAARGQNDVAVRAMAILDDPNREFASSIFVLIPLSLSSGSGKMYPYIPASPASPQ